METMECLQEVALDSLVAQMVNVLRPFARSHPSGIGQIFQEVCWDVRDENTTRALSEAICMLTWNQQTDSWDDDSLKMLLPLLGLPNPRMFPIVWKQVEYYLTRKSIKQRKGEGLWNIMYSLNMTTSWE